MAGKPQSRGRRPANKEFAVIGLGRFGGAFARRLEYLGHTVLGVDLEIARVQEFSDELTSVVALDATVEDALQEVDIASFDTVIVAIADDFEASALITAYLKRLDIPRVICLGKTRRHQDILLRIGADQVIVSDEDSGIRLAEALATPNLLERIVLDSEHSMVQLKAPSSLAGQPITSFDRYGIAVILIQRSGRLIPCPGADVRLEANDAVFAVGPRQKLLDIAALT